MDDHALALSLQDQKTAVINGGRVPPVPNPLSSRVPGPPHEGTLDHYDLLEVLGRGGCGVVRKAFDRKLRREVAIKTMAAELAATSAARKRFVREAHAAAAVSHENVVQIYAVEDGDPPYLVMEYVPGLSLHRHLTEHGPLGVAEVLRVGAQVARGLAAAHEKGLIHRDVKPANILVERDGNALRVKLTDFGIARSADDASLTHSGVVVGTPMYMSPEQAEGEALDHRSDLFSLGSVLYEMVCGHPPFRAATGLAVLKRVAENTPRPVREIMPETPEWLCSVIARLQARRPGDRFQTAREVADLFDRLLAAGSQADLVLPPVAPARRPVGRWLALIMGVVLATGVGVGLVGHRPAPARRCRPTTPTRPPARHHRPRRHRERCRRPSGTPTPPAPADGR